MTSILARPYLKETTLTIPTFSRERPKLLFQHGDRILIHAFPRFRPLRCSWQVSRNMVERSFLAGEGEPDFDQSVTMHIPSDSLRPGFYDLAFSCYSSTTEHEDGRCTFGYCVDEIPLPATRPADFDAFWNTAAATVSQTPLNATATPVAEMDDAQIAQYNLEHAALPANYDPDGVRCHRVKVYKVQFDAPNKRRMYAWLATPDGPGPYPGLLLLPGAGCGRLPMPVEHARHGYVTLLLQIHGQDVDQPEYSSPPGYLQYLSAGYGERLEEDYYYTVFQSCVQAVRYLEQRPEVDPHRLAVVGASQGGMLSMVTAALCPQVKAVVSSLCFYADFPDRDYTALLNKKRKDGVADTMPPADARQRYLAYFDVMNFAPRVKGATLMCACLCDTPSPVTGPYAVYRRLGKIRKELVWSPGTNHDLMFAFERRAWRWLDDFGVK